MLFICIKIYQHENELFTLRQANQDLLFKYEKLGVTVNRKRRSTNSSSLKKAIYNSNFDHLYNSNFTSNTSNKKLNYSKTNSNTNTNTNTTGQYTNMPFLFEQPKMEQQEQRADYQDIEEDQDLEIFKVNI